MKLGMIFTEEEKEVLEELDEIYDKIVNATIFDCGRIDCDNCPFYEVNRPCAIIRLPNELKAIKERK